MSLSHKLERGEFTDAVTPHVKGTSCSKQRHPVVHVVTSAPSSVHETPAWIICVTQTFTAEIWVQMIISKVEMTSWCTQWRKRYSLLCLNSGLLNLYLIT